MATTIMSRGSARFDSSIDPNFRHIPVKRIAPCPPSDFIHAQPKRSRMGPDSTQLAKRPSLSVRNVNMQNDTHARAISWGQANCFQSYASVGVPVTPCADMTAVKGLRYDPINSSNVSRVSRAATVSDMKKSRCCPVLTSSSGFSTPPYSINNVTSGKDSKKSSRRRPLSQRLKRRSAEGKKLKSTGCLSVLKNAAHNTLRTAEACIEKNVPQPELNALSVYHTFLKQREEATRVEKSSQNQQSTVMTQVSSMTRMSNTSVRYSSNFNPPLTSTPQKFKNVASSDFDGEFKKPCPPQSRKTESTETPLTEVLKILEEERKAGSSHISLPLRELTEMVVDLQKQRSDESMPDTNSCASSTGTVATNNNNEDLSVKLKPKIIAKSRLPGMYPIGAPRAASSPIPSFRKREFAIFDESCVDESTVKSHARKRHMAGEFNDSVFSTGVDGGATDVWRPW